MKKIKNKIFRIFMLAASLAAVYSFPVYGEENAHQTNGQTAFYGEYNYPKETPKEEPKNKLPGTENEQKQTYDPVYSINYDTPNRVGGKPMLPSTGDQSLVAVQLIGIASLSLLIGITWTSKNKLKNGGVLQ